MLCITRHKPFWMQQSQARRKFRCVNYSQIKVCSDCKHFNENNNTCKLISFINSDSKVITSIRSLHCRTNEELCGMQARFFSPTTKELKKTSISDTDEYASYAEYAENLYHLMDED